MKDPIRKGGWSEAARGGRQNFVCHAKEFEFFSYKERGESLNDLIKAVT